MITELQEINIVGISSRTNNLVEMDPQTAKIGTMKQRFFQGNLQNNIPNRKNPGRVFAIYTNYESDFTGDYTFFIGEEVTAFEGIKDSFETLTIPPQSYKKFTSPPGVMPYVLIDMWQKIWKMSNKDLEGERAYIADFEIYDRRSIDPDNTVIDIYIGMRE